VPKQLLQRNQREKTRIDMGFLTSLSSTVRSSWHYVGNKQDNVLVRVHDDNDDEEEASTTSLQSTVTVHDEGLTCQQVNLSRNYHNKRNRKVVHIDEDQNMYYDNTTGLYKEDLKALWSNGAEIKQFKATTVAIARAMGRSVHNNGQASTESPMNDLFQQLTYKHILLAAYDACCQTLTERTSLPLTADETKQLEIMTQSSSFERVGLESLCVPEIRLDKQARRNQIVDAVVDLCHADEETIREVSQSISRAPRLYARAIAMAQWSSS
jgi:hypothetical protein